MTTASLEHSLTMTVEIEWKKMKHDEEPVTTYDITEVKRPRQCYFRLESESSVLSEDGTESVYSVQDKETDFARDTSDTDTKSDSDKSEYEVESLSEDDNCPVTDNSSSGTEDFLEGVIAAAICDTSLDAWLTDVETSDSDSMEELDIGPTKFISCIQCKSRNDNPKFQFCDKCYQVRKTMFPPRPRGRNRRRNKKKISEVKLTTLQNCLSGLSQDSGLGSSQELQSLELHEIIVPDHIKSSLEDNAKSTSLTTKESLSSDVNNHEEKSETNSCQKRKRSESNEEENINEENLPKKIKSEETVSQNGKLDLKNYEKETKVSNPQKRKRDELNENNDGEDLSKRSKILNNNEKIEKLATSIQSRENDKNNGIDLIDVCIICNSEAKNSIFLHGSIGHRCCCYKCGVKVWKNNRRCPVCNRKVQNIVKVFTI